MKSERLRCPAARAPPLRAAPPQSRPSRRRCCCCCCFPHPPREEYETGQRLPGRRRRRLLQEGGDGAHLPPQHGHVQPPPAARHQLHPPGRAPPALRADACLGRLVFFLVVFLLIFLLLLYRDDCNGRRPPRPASPPSGHDFQEGAGGGLPSQRLLLGLFLAEEPLGLLPVPGQHQAREAQRPGGRGAPPSPPPLRGPVWNSWGGAPPNPWRQCCCQWRSGRGQPERHPGPQPFPPLASPSP